MKRNSFYLVEFRRDGSFSPVEHITIKAPSALDAKIEAEEKTKCYEVVNILKYIDEKTWKY